MAIQRALIKSSDSYVRVFVIDRFVRTYANRSHYIGEVHAESHEHALALARAEVAPYQRWLDRGQRFETEGFE